MLGGLFTFAVNKLFLRPLLNKDLMEEGLDQYYKLDLNAAMMKKDLAEFGIKI